MRACACVCVRARACVCVCVCVRVSARARTRSCMCFNKYTSSFFEVSKYSELSVSGQEHKHYAFPFPLPKVIIFAITEVPQVKPTYPSPTARTVSEDVKEHSRRRRSLQIQSKHSFSVALLPQRRYGLFGARFQGFIEPRTATSSFTDTSPTL